jgi:peptidase M50B-like protein
MDRFWRLAHTPAVLISATLLASWLGMQAVHELGHVIAALLTGGEVVRVVLHPLTISRTDLASNPQPLIVVWGGPLGGVLMPLVAWGLAGIVRLPGAFVLRFFAGFCLIANGLYIGLGSLGAIGDCGEMLRHGSSLWQLWLFGIFTTPAGIWLWHGEGKHFGIGPNAQPLSAAITYVVLAVAVVLLAVGLLSGGLASK